MTARLPIAAILALADTQITRYAASKKRLECGVIEINLVPPIFIDDMG
jgi:hypothetical protein